MQSINYQIRAFLQTAPTESALTDFINNLAPQLKPTLKFHQQNLKALKEPTLVYAHLMVQDIRDSYYYYSFLMKRPFHPQDKFLLYRWGNDPLDPHAEDAVQSDEYLKVMLERQPVHCTPVTALTDWAISLQGAPEPIELLVDGKADFKLGETINIVAFYYPDHHKLYFVRKVASEQADAEGLNPIALMGKATPEYPVMRQELMNLFCSYCSESFAEYLLICLLSDEPMFLGADADVSPLIEAVYPRVRHLKLVHPCEESLFPYKNQEGQLIMGPMQLSSDPTFVSIDFSSFSQESNVQIGENTINNFKALKVFAEESRTIYRWEYGESLVEHKHRGIIVKAASFITPHYYPKEQGISCDFSTLKNTAPEALHKFREYLAAAKRVVPVLEIQQRTKIQLCLKQEVNKELLGSKLAQVMQLSKLLARSHGRTSILISDFQRARYLCNQLVSKSPL